MTERFKENKIESPRLISEMLLSYILDGQRIDLYANVDRIATEEEREALRSLVKRALAHEPVQYIVGKAWFNGLEFDVNTSTLIPRTCTERIVEQCLEHLNVYGGATTPRIADIGTGTGCIAISIAKHAQSALLTATDISDEALSLAIENAKNHNVDSSITFIQGDGLCPLESLESLDIICSNPPYIPDHEFGTLGTNVRDWEPKLALEGGKTGLNVIEPLLREAPNYLNTDGMVLIEIASSTSSQVLNIAQGIQGLSAAAILKDIFGDERFLRARKV